jgi:hypothetical protein
VHQLTGGTHGELQEGDESAVTVTTASFRDVRAERHGGTPHRGRETEVLSRRRTLGGAVNRAGDVSRAV